MNTKISDAAVSPWVSRWSAAIDAAARVLADCSGHGMREKVEGVAEKALAAALPHLAADAVPVGYRWRHSASEAWQYSDQPCGWEFEPLYTHPQPAAPNEVSGNSGELGGDERARFEAWAEVQTTHGNEHVLTRVGPDDDRYLSPLASTMWSAWQAALAATGKQPLQVGEAQGVNLSPIATRKLGELAEQGYVTNGVAIFNPTTGQRGLVDNLGFVGWMGAVRIDLGKVHAAVESLLEFADHHESCGDTDAYNNAEFETCGCGFDSAREAIWGALDGQRAAAPEVGS